MEKGFFYIATTPQYAQKNIFKVGTTKNLYLEFEKLNFDRLHDEEYYIILYLQTFSYKILEYNIFEKLKIYKIKNNLFLCDLVVIQNIFNNFINSRSFMTFFYDYLYLLGVYQDIRWDNSLNIFTVSNVVCAEKFIIVLIRELFNYYDMKHLLSCLTWYDYQIYLQFLKDNFHKQNRL